MAVARFSVLVSQAVLANLHRTSPINLNFPSGSVLFIVFRCTIMFNVKLSCLNYLISDIFELAFFNL